MFMLVPYVMLIPQLHLLYTDKKVSTLVGDFAICMFAAISLDTTFATLPMFIMMREPLRIGVVLGNFIKLGICSTFVKRYLAAIKKKIRPNSKSWFLKDHDVFLVF